MLPCIWMSPVHTQHKKACFVRLRGCPYAPTHLDSPICLDAPCMFRCHHMLGWPPVCLDAHLYVWTSPCLDAPCMFGCHLCLDTPLYGWMPHVWTSPFMLGCPPYVWLPPVCLEAAKCMVVSKGMRDIQTWG